MKDRIKSLIVERLKLERDPASIGDSEPLFGPEGLGLDSIDALELVLGLEQEFGVCRKTVYNDLDALQAAGVPLYSEMVDGEARWEMDFDDRSLKAQLSLADRLEARWVVLLEDRELAAGEAVVRDMADGSQTAVSLTEINARLKTLGAGK